MYRDDRRAPDRRASSYARAARGRRASCTTPEVERRIAEFRELLDDAQSYARDFMPRQQVFAFGGVWKGFSWAGDDWGAAHRRPARPC